MAEEPKIRTLLHPSVNVTKARRREKTNLPGFLAGVELKTPHWLREALAEIVGTFILVVFGLGAMAQTILSKGDAGTYFTKNIASGMALAMAIYWAGSISGGHVNPAFTIALASVQRIPLRKVPIYVISQLLGAFLSAAVVYAIYHDGIQEYDGGIRQVLGPNGTAGIFTTFPKEFVTNMTGFWDQFFGTAMLVALIFPVLDKKNNSRPSPGLTPLIIGFILFLIGMTFGFNCGYPLNPAADLGPRIFIAMAGWGSEVFTAHGHWAWIPLVACPLGGITGAYLYIFTVEIHRREEEGVDENYDDKSNEKIRMIDSEA